LEQLPTQPTPAPSGTQCRPDSRLRLALLCFSTVVLAAIGSLLGHGFAAPGQNEAPPHTPAGHPIASHPNPSARPIVAAPTPTAPPSGDPTAVVVLQPATRSTPTPTSNADKWILPWERFAQATEQWPAMNKKEQNPWSFRHTTKHIHCAARGTDLYDSSR